MDDQLINFKHSKRQDRTDERWLPTKRFTAGDFVHVCRDPKSQKMMVYRAKKTTVSKTRDGILTMDNKGMVSVCNEHIYIEYPRPTLPDEVLVQLRAGKALAVVFKYVRFQSGVPSLVYLRPNRYKQYGAETTNSKSENIVHPLEGKNNIEQEKSSPKVARVYDQDSLLDTPDLKCEESLASYQNPKQNFFKWRR